MIISDKLVMSHVELVEIHPHWLSCTMLRVLLQQGSHTKAFNVSIHQLSALLCPRV